MTLSLDRLTPKGARLQGSDTERRARAVVIAGGIVCAVGLYIAFVQYTRASKFIGVSALVLAVFAALGAEYARRSGRWEPVGVGICVGIFVVAAAVVGITGGTMHAASFYLGLVPVVATIFFGVRAGASIVVLNIVFLTGIEVMRRNEFEFPLWIPDEIVAQSAYRGAMVFEGVLFAMAVVYDVLRRAGLRDLAESEARYRALSTQSTDLVFELDSDGTILHAAEEHAAALGWTAGEVIGRPASDFVYEGDRPRIPGVLAIARRDGTSHAEDVRLLHRDGTFHWYEPSLTSFRAEGHDERLLIIARSLDDRLRAEMQQRQSQKMDAVGQLASGVAHDFNNLLMVVGSYAQLLSDELPPGEQRDAAHEILQASQQGEALTRQLVAVSRPGSNSPEPTDPNEVIRRAERILTQLAGDSISVELSLQADLQPVIADAGHLDQILVNLTVNARDAMPEGGSLSIRTANSEDVVYIQVADTGVGIDPEVRDRIFEAFFTTKSRQHGTGLGLYVVYTLVQQMGGSIDIDSAVGAGTTVTIALPATRERASFVHSVPHSDREAIVGTETILLVEDRAPLREIVARTLRKAGYTVVVAGDGEEGLERARGYDGSIDLVLSDVVMPRMTGPDMARILRDEMKKTRFLFMSGHPERAREIAEELSEDRLIAKPIEPRELLQNIRDALDRPN